MACPTIRENLWLLDIQFIYFLRFIIKYFTVKLKNFCPTSQSIVCGVFLWYSWGNSHFLLCVGKLFSWGFLVRSCVPVAWSPCRVLQLLPSGEKEVKANFRAQVWLHSRWNGFAEVVCVPLAAALARRWFVWRAWRHNNEITTRYRGGITGILVSC